MFIDASVFVAILTDENGWEELADKVGLEAGAVTSAIAIWETTVRLMRKTDLSEVAVRAEFGALLNGSGITIVIIGETEARLATEAYARYGKGRHPAALNMGDCFAYACAKSNQIPLLYIGNDFSQTDVNDGFETLN